MTVSDAWPLQQTVYSAVAGAMAAEGVEVFDHVPTNPPAEYVRLEGSNIDDTSWKDTERGRHSVVISAFTRPVGTAVSSVGQSRVKALCGLIHDAVKDLRHGKGRMQFEFMNVESDNDGVTSMGMLRYTIIL